MSVEQDAGLVVDVTVDVVRLPGTMSICEQRDQISFRRAGSIGKLTGVRDMGDVSGDDCLLVADIGGTHARFALAAVGRPGFYNEVQLRCADFASPEQAIEQYLESVRARAPQAICIAAAGHAEGGSVQLTNNPWRVNMHALKQHFGAIHGRLLNDFEAIAYALPALQSDHLVTVGEAGLPRCGADTFVVGVMGPGTGLGAAGLVGHDGAVVPLVTEAGHVGFAPQTYAQREVHAKLLAEFGRVSCERVVSGPGLENVYSALAQIRRRSASTLDAREILGRCVAGDDQLAAEAVALMFDVFGQAAGDFVLAIGAFDGVFLAGGMVQRHAELLARSNFRHRFEEKGRHRGLMERVPTALIVHEQPGLLGASIVARRIATRVST